MLLQTAGRNIRPALPIQTSYYAFSSQHGGYLGATLLDGMSLSQGRLGIPISGGIHRGGPRLFNSTMTVYLLDISA
jgi:hypothetical protein